MKEPRAPALSTAIQRRLAPTRPRLWSLLAVLAASLLVSLASQVAVPVPLSPVPVTAQSLALVLVGAVLGARPGALALVFYILLGVLGLPVFSDGKSGFETLAGPTGGYLVGFVPAALLVGALAERGLDRRFATAFPAFLAGQLVIFAFGLPWLARFVAEGEVLQRGLWPFLPGLVLKALIAALLMSTVWRRLRHIDL